MCIRDSADSVYAAQFVNGAERAGNAAVGHNPPRGLGVDVPGGRHFRAGRCVDIDCAARGSRLRLTVRPAFGRVAARPDFAAFRPAARIYLSLIHI